MKNTAVKIAKILFSVLTGAAALAMLTLYFLTSSTQFFLAGTIAIICTVFGITAKTKWLIPYIIGAVVVLLYAGFTGQFSSTNAFQYPFQKWYAHEKGGFDVSFFPEKLPNTIYSYSTVFMPSVLQGSGHYSVVVETDEKTVDEIKTDAEKRAIEILPLSECLDEYTIEDCISDNTGAFHYVHKDSDKDGFFVYIPKEAMKSYEDYYLYVIYTDYDFNHPDTRAYIINDISNIVVWSII